MKPFVPPKRPGEYVDTARMSKKQKITAESLKRKPRKPRKPRIDAHREE